MHKKNEEEIQKELEDFFGKDEKEKQMKDTNDITEERKTKENNNEVEEQQKKENIEKMLITISNNKKIPKDILKKIYSDIFVNLGIAILVMAYLLFIILGYLNIEKNIYELDLKVFTGILFILTIFLMEKAYKKGDAKLTIHSIECLCLSIFNLFFLYFYTIFYDEYKIIIGTISLLFGFYYMIKSIIILVIMRSKFLHRMSDITEILSSDYDKEDFKCQEV